MPVRVLIADDHRLFAEALASVFAADGRIAVVAHARDGREAVKLADELQPDVVLLDIGLPVLDGVEAARAICADRPDACILMLTGSSSRADVDRSREAGAAGYVTKDRLPAEVIEAIVDLAATWRGP